jgi:translation initiation factor IF-2
MGHVDHGKTSLLDAIRKTGVAAREYGGITQHIGAYQVEFSVKGTKHKITFIDTPGHAAFTKMRARGAQVTDLVVLVVAASDGVMPQTKESLEHIKAAGIPFLVAINKIDLPEADINKVKSQLAEIGVLVEGYGGEIVAVPVSAKTSEGLTALLEMITLLGEMQSLKADPEGLLEGVVLESRSDSRHGVTATILVKNGTLKIGEEVKAENSTGKVKAMFDQSGKSVSLAGPSLPVEVLGLNQVPPAGAVVSSLKSGGISGVVATSEDSLITPSKAGEDKFKVILKADVSGSLEALLGMIDSDVQIIACGLDVISESDVLLAKTTNSLIYGFNIKPSASAEKLANEEKVEIRVFRIIYELAEDLKKQVLFFKNPHLAEKIIGKASILAEFKINQDRIAGCRVTEGKIAKNDSLHIVRAEVIIGDTRIKSLRIKKDEVAEVRLNQEFGAILHPYIDFKIGDVLVSYQTAPL